MAQIEKIFDIALALFDLFAALFFARPGQRLSSVNPYLGICNEASLDGRGPDVNPVLFVEVVL